VSVADLFMAGVIPGIIAATAIGIVAFAIAARHGYGKRTEPFSWRAVQTSFVKALPAFIMPIIVLGGIYAGIFTPTEAAAISVIYGVAVGMLVYRTVSLRDLPSLFSESAQSTASVLFILSGALFIGMLATLAGIPQAIVGAVDAMQLSPLGFLFATSVILIFLGCFLDGFTLLTVVTPLLLPSVHALGINPIHFGIIIVLNNEIAAITPPIGLNLFVITGISGVTMQEVIAGVFPFVIVMIAVLVLLTLVPYFSLALI
jgi:C4-dicarboxylate transporter DctM subunit